MKTACGRIHFGPLLENGICIACGRALTPVELITYRRLRLQVKAIIIEAHEFLVDYLKKRAV